ncbi:MAG: DUF58 domain-containing protein, partial [Candidatus Eremiobacteraeota bacterium]|nr:DUF58 domain-containing protein [Candidatus Eremiobacteraeota bacterium]
MRDAGGAIRRALLQGRRRPVVRFGSRPYPRRGDGFEISELRGYVEGDDPRRIDWAATARAGAPIVRVLLEERALCFAAILDDSRSMEVGRRRPLRAAAYDALDAWGDALAREDRAVRVYDGDIDAPPLRGRPAALHLCRRRESGAFDLAAALGLARWEIPRDSVLLAISDFYSPLEEESLRELAVHADCTALIARDPFAQRPDGFPLRGFVRVRDAESSRTRLVFLGRASTRRIAVAARER